MPLRKIITVFISFLLIFFLGLGLLTKTSFAVEVLPEKEYRDTVTNPTYTLEDNHFLNTTYSIYDINTVIWEPGGENEQSLMPGGGALSQTGKFISYLIGHPPVTTSEYLADLGQNMGLPIRSAHAQGTGWQALRPVLPIWKAFRNIAYLGFVIIFIVIGFMIMFRKNIDSQTVVTIQAALPKLIVTLLLITFSYAIAGLMIDLIYIAIYLVVGILSLSGVLTTNSNALDLLFSKNPFGLVFVKEGADIFIQAPGEALQDIIEGLFGSWFKDTVLAEAFGGLAKLVLGVALLFSLFKLFFTLLLSYLGIIVNVIFAPFNILFNALPGSNAFMAWIKNLLSNVAPFPVVAGMFLLAAVIIGPKSGAACGDRNNKWCVQQDIGYYPQAEKGEAVWVPPMLNLGKEGGGGEANAFQALIAFGMIMLTPQVVSKIKKMLEVEPSGFGGAILGGITAGPSAVGGLATTGLNLGTQILTIKGAKDRSGPIDELRKGMSRESEENK